MTCHTPFWDHGSRGPWSFPFCPPHSPDLSGKRVSRSLLGAGNYPWGPLGPILSGCTLTLSLNPFNKARVIPTTGLEQCALIRAQTHSNTHRVRDKDHRSIYLKYRCLIGIETLKTGSAIYMFHLLWYIQLESVYTIAQYWFVYQEKLRYTVSIKVSISLKALVVWDSCGQCCGNMGFTGFLHQFKEVAWFVRYLGSPKPIS